MKKSLIFIALILLFINSCKKEEIKSNEAKITSFTVANVKGTIDEIKKEAMAVLPVFSDITALPSTFQVSTGATLLQGTVTQQNGITTNNFTNPVTFTVQAEDGTKVNYNVIVTVTKSNEAKLLSFSFKKLLNNTINVSEDVVGCLKNTTMTMNLLETDLNFPNAVSIIPSFSISKGAKLLIEGIEQESDKSTYKFSSLPTNVTVKAQDGTEQKYTLNLTSQILNIEEFMKKCPTDDILFSKFIKDFEIRRNGVVVTNYDCDDKYDVVLRILQAIRVIYYVDIYKKAAYLPWTNMRYYDWLKDKVQGFDIVDDLGGAVGVCCKDINGRKFISLASAKNQSTAVVKYTYQEWAPFAGFISLIGHERRHADPGNYPHNGNCNGVGGDADYNEKNLGSYGVAYWLSKAFKSGILEVGVKCLSAPKQDEINVIIGVNNWAATYFCKNAPPVTIPANYKECTCQ
jgi:hypothetical protein